MPSRDASQGRQLKLFVGVTDGDWFRHLAAQPSLDEVNFWRPSGKDFKAIQTGELFLFKLHHPANVIVGGGFLARSLILPVNLAWEAFGQANGARTLTEVKARIGQYRHQPIGPFDNPAIGCVLLAEPFFLPQKDWIEVPSDFAKNIVQGKTYTTDTEMGQQLYKQVADRLRRWQGLAVSTPAVEAVIHGPRYGAPRPVAPRLGQGTFRALVTEAYNRRCAVTGERTLPVLEAAHIRPYGAGGEHALGNGLLLRSDLHRLYDGRYVTVDPDEHRLLVSRRIREEFENGRHYYALEGQKIAAPQKGFAPPDTNNLRYHAEQIYRG